MTEFDDPAGALVFDPVPRVEGLEASGDPILNFRPGAYELSARQRSQPNCGRP